MVAEIGNLKDYPAFGSGTYNVTKDTDGHNSLTVNLAPGEFKLIIFE